MHKKINRALWCIAILAFPLISGCTGIAPKPYEAKNDTIVDPTLNLSKGDYMALPIVKDAKTKISKGDISEPPIPDLAPILSAPPVPKLGQTKLVSIAVTDDVPLKDVLLELARLADVDMQVDAGISGGISFRATQRPFNEVIERICDFAGLRYTMKNGVLSVQRDTPYVEMYTLDFLNIERATTNSVSLSTSVLSGTGIGSGGGSGLTTGSTTSITSNTQSDFWTKFESGVAQIMAYTPESHMSVYSAPKEQVAASLAPAPSTEGEAKDGKAADAQKNPTVVIVNPSGAGAQPAAASPNTATIAPATAPADPSKAIGYTINKQAGTLTVMATERQHRLIKEFIKRIDYNASAQVLIEAKIVEVTLNEQYQSGINWTDFGGSSVKASTIGFGGITDGLGSSTFNVTKNGITGLDISLDLALDLMQKFGTTRTLSSPRLHAINNQQAVMTFAKNEVYFNVKVGKEETDQTATSSARTTFTVDSEIKTVPIGIIMSLLPSINRDTGDITLSVRPTLSRVVDRVIDPGLTLIKALDPAFADVNIENKIPVVEVRELDSILKVKSGQVMVIGGLMEDKGIDTQTGVPGVQDVPVFGNLFKGVDRSRTTSELVILIRATQVGTNGGLGGADRAVYEKFTQDPRPVEEK